MIMIFEGPTGYVQVHRLNLEKKIYFTFLIMWMLPSVFPVMVCVGGCRVPQTGFILSIFEAYIFPLLPKN